MSVVNVRVAFIRPEFRDLEDWCKTKNNIYIGRGGILIINGRRYPEKDSVWANPFKLERDGTRDEVLEKYIRDRLEKEPKLREELIKLKGKKLGCWCYPERCHGDVLLKLIQEYK